MGGIGEWWNNVASGKYAADNAKAADEFWTQGGGKGVHDFFLGEKAAAPTAPVLNYGPSNEARGQQMALLAQLQAMAAGTGPSLAQGQLQQATDSNIANAMALGAAQQGQGLGYSSALRQIADQSAAARQQSAAQSAMIRNAEQMQAMQGIGALTGQIRGQDSAQTALGAQHQLGYDQMNFQASAANANRGVLGPMLNAGGALLGMGLGQNAQGSQAAPTGLMANASGPVLNGGFRTTSPPLGDWTQPYPAGAPMYASAGGCVPGYARGGQLDSTANDTVPAMLSPGEIVLPRSITMAPDAEERAKMFVQQILSRRKRPRESGEHPALRDMARRKAA